MQVRALLGILLVFAGFALAGCSGSGTSDESQVRGRYSEWARAMENERVDHYMLIFSPNYLDNGYDYVEVRIFAAELFDQYEIQDVSHQFQTVQVAGNFADVWGTEIIDALDTFDGNRPVRITTDFNDIWRYESGNWYLYGNQRSNVMAQPAPFRHSKENFNLNAKPKL